MTIIDMIDYMRLLFEALENIHGNRVVHRDIKPSNFMFSPRGDNADNRARGLLVDFGLAQDLKMVDSGKEAAQIWKKADPRWREFAKKRTELHKNGSANGTFPKDKRPQLKASRAGTRGFRAPEVLFKCISEQGPALDIWSAGVILLTMMTRRYPFFQSADDCDAIVEIACLFGNENMARCAETLGRRWFCNVPSVPSKHVGWPSVVANLCPDAYSSLSFPAECFHFLERCLCLDPRERITASQALQHPFIRLGLEDGP
jgi:cell division control protein 7